MAKITNVMKMVASSKLKSVEDMLSKGKAFGVRWARRRGRRGRAGARMGGPLRRARRCPATLAAALATPLQQSLLNALALKEAPRSRDEKDADSALVRKRRE